MRTFDFSPLYRSAIGIDRFANLLDEALRMDSQPSYPPYNIELTGDNQYRITMAVAGFADGELEIEVKGDTLLVTGRKEKEPADERKYLYQGIAARNFERRFQLADHVKVTAAHLEHGLLHVDLVREIPEEKKPRKIAINGGSKAALLESEVAAH
ncbi:MAG: Hsp20 family protein [Corallincola sp.]|nr:Hsp20 family protein [Corallincola sp.]